LKLWNTLRYFVMTVFRCLEKASYLVCSDRTRLSLSKSEYVRVSSLSSDACL
jgi:hypothetical protein